jgi:dephospho-CoA kinase
MTGNTPNATVIRPQRQPRTLPVIGLVGGIGSGKSLVAAELQRCGGHLISGDHLGHEALRQPDIKASVVERWGHEVLDAEGNVNRRLLGAKVFADPRERAALESIVFPYIEQHIEAEIETAQILPAAKFIVLDAAIMIETGWSQRCDKVVFVDAPRPLRLERLRQRGWSEEEVTRRERAQMSLDEKRRHSDAVLTNAAGPDEVALQVRDLLAAWGI